MAPPRPPEPASRALPLVAPLGLSELKVPDLPSSLSLATPIVRYLLHNGEWLGRRGMLHFSTEIAAILTAFIIVQAVILAVIVVRLLVD